MSLARGIAAVVLAGDRGADDPIARATKSACKALSPVAGEPMISRVLDALTDRGDIERIVVCGPARKIAEADAGFQARLERDDRISWIDQGASPATSTVTALDQLSAEETCLVTTADHALLTPDLLAHFLDRALKRPEDVVVGLARLDAIHAAFPGSRRTAFRLRDGAFCGCNLFLMRGARGRLAAAYWRKVEDLRKKPWRIASVFGYRALLGLLTRRLDLAGALAIVGSRMGITVGAVLVTEAELAVDVDSVEDLELVERILRGRAETAG